MGKRGERLQVEMMDVLTRAEAPLSAYDILAELRGVYPKMAPTTIYRALKVLLDQGRIHRLESLNAYMPCQCPHDHDPDQPHQSVLSICDDCGAVEENDAPELLETLGHVIGKSGFEAQRHVIEVHGRCAECGPDADRSAG